MMKRTVKKAAITGLAAMMMLGGTASVYADGKGKGNAYGHDKNGKKHEKSHKAYHEDWNKLIKQIFKDVDPEKFAWAVQHILNLAAQGVFNGYLDGTFQPNKTITRIEAITAAVRLMGLEAQAKSDAEMKVDLNFKDADKLEKKYPWAIGYVSVALKNDLFGETERFVHPEKPADRLWATTLLVKALKLDAEAQAKMNTKLNFKDAREIPAGSVGYVAVALEKGLITGYTDNTFRPHKPVTRAEMSALLDRTGEQMPDYDAQLISGTLTLVTSSGITVKRNDGTELTLAVSPNVFIFRNNVKAGIDSLVAGDEVTIRTHNNIVVFIDVTKAHTPAANFSATGKISSITRTSDGKIQTISLSNEVNGGTQVVIYNVAENATIQPQGAQLMPNMNVEVKGLNGVVTSIEIK
jgi:hypothetical protein